jgi:hypothetical protein
MSVEQIVAELNSEIGRLQAALAVLNGGKVRASGRPRGMGAGRLVRRRRPMSAATKAKIAAAMKKSWASGKRG